jgi:hypothetical protein
MADPKAYEAKLAWKRKSFQDMAPGYRWLAAARQLPLAHPHTCCRAMRGQWQHARAADAGTAHHCTRAAGLHAASTHTA